MNRFSSRRQRLGSSFLTPRLQGALGYDRIAGYFSSSLLEVAGEALETVAGPIRMVCNSAIEPKDLITARLARTAMRREWCESQPEALGDSAKGRFKRLYSVEDGVHQLLSSRLQGISNLFGQLPDVLEDAWIDVAIGEVERARRIIDAVPRQHPFPLRYHKITKVDWESCAKVLDSRERKAYLSRGWR